MDDNFDSIFGSSNQFEGKKAKIKCVGVGGGGGNAINTMVTAGIEDVTFVAINTDAQDLMRSKAIFRLQVGEKLTKGLGVGGDPTKGREAALESCESLKLLVDDTDLLFITAGMGGGTGTGVAPELARIAKETYGDNILVVGVVTRPFKSEGFPREQIAQKGLEALRRYADCVIVVPNDRICENIGPETSMEEAFKLADQVLLQAVKGISEVILKPGEINIDYNDLKKIMLNSGQAIIGRGKAKGRNRHIEAVEQAINSPLLENSDITGAKGVIVFFSSAEKITMLEQQEAVNIINQSATKRAFIKFGYMHDASIPKGELEITVIATGFQGNMLSNTARFKARNYASAFSSVPSSLRSSSLNGRIRRLEMLRPSYMRRKMEDK
ncbi:MAG: cell division protein FtsZ [Elusimicrobiaceae bacterium]|nr:cell division protein FtsZ [Elusimicrobiaceae bacterium]